MRVVGSVFGSGRVVGGGVRTEHLGTRVRVERAIARGHVESAVVVAGVGGDVHARDSAQARVSAGVTEHVAVAADAGYVGVTLPSLVARVRVGRGIVGIDDAPRPVVVVAKRTRGRARRQRRTRGRGREIVTKRTLAVRDGNPAAAAAGNLARGAARVPVDRARGVGHVPAGKRGAGDDADAGVPVVTREAGRHGAGDAGEDASLASRAPPRPRFWRFPASSPRPEGERCVRRVPTVTTHIPRLENTRGRSSQRSGRGVRLGVRGVGVK